VVEGNPLAGRTGIDLFNSSQMPIYGLVVGIVFIQGAGPETLETRLALDSKSAMPLTAVSILPPGTFRVWIPGTGWSSIMSGRAGAEVAFTDRAGRHWIRRADGELVELHETPLEYFERCGLDGPYELQLP